MKRIAILTPGFLPVPSVKGGAIEEIGFCLSFSLKPTVNCNRKSAYSSLSLARRNPDFGITGKPAHKNYFVHTLLSFLSFVLSND